MILAIIQARMLSTRLPGKVMKKVLGNPLMFYLLQRLKAIKRINKIIVATTVDKADDALAKFIKSQMIDVFRGSEKDVLERVYQTAAAYKPKHIVWITADCPLIDPVICNQLIDFYLKKKLDFAYLSSKFAEGLDCGIFTFKALKTAFQKARMQSEHEHITLFIRNHPENFKIATLKNKNDDGKYRITIDEPEDFEVVKAIIKGLYKKDCLPFGFSKIKLFLDNHPAIFKKNTHIIRNEGLLISLKKDKRVK